MNFRLPLLLVTAGTLALAGCVDPYNTQYDPNARAKNGAITGALIGAGAGAILGRGDRTAQAVAGAAVGAAVGGVIGHSLDQQAAELRAQINDDRISVTNTGNALVVNMPQDILFATDSDTVSPDLKAELNGVARNLMTYPNSTIEVIGHTDNTGTAAHNMALSQRRAGAVAGVLIGAGVQPARIQTLGQGENQPIATNMTPEGRARNRRVEIIIHPNG